jgi:hypothetical protein
VLGIGVVRSVGFGILSHAIEFGRRPEPYNRQQQQRAQEQERQQQLNQQSIQQRPAFCVLLCDPPVAVDAQEWQRAAGREILGGWAAPALPAHRTEQGAGESAQHFGPNSTHRSRGRANRSLPFYFRLHWGQARLYLRNLHDCAVQSFLELGAVFPALVQELFGIAPLIRWRIPKV